MSAMVRAVRRALSWAREERPSSVTDRCSQHHGGRLGEVRIGYVGEFGYLGIGDCIRQLVEPVANRVFATLFPGLGRREKGGSKIPHAVS